MAPLKRLVPSSVEWAKLEPAGVSTVQEFVESLDTVSDGEDIITSKRSKIRFCCSICWPLQPIWNTYLTTVSHSTVRIWWRNLNSSLFILLTICYNGHLLGHCIMIVGPVYSLHQRAYAVNCMLMLLGPISGWHCLKGGKGEWGADDTDMNAHITHVTYITLTSHISHTSHTHHTHVTYMYITYRSHTYMHVCFWMSTMAWMVILLKYKVLYSNFKMPYKYEAIKTTKTSMV